MRLATPAIIIALAGMPAFAQTDGPVASASAQPTESADQILAAISAVEYPQYDRAAAANDPNYRTTFYQQRTEAMRAEADLIGQLLKTDPKNDALIELLPKRWSLLSTSLSDPTGALEETTRAMRRFKGTPLEIEAAYARANALGLVEGYDSPAFIPAFEEFARLAPDDGARGSRLLMTAARSLEGDAALAMYTRIVKSYPESRNAGYAKGKVRQFAGINKPFELTFTEATTGETINMKDLRGKVVVIDFWATWCGPCIAEMPHMKDLYATYKDKGVEFIGVSLDQPEDKGGLKKLQDYVASNEIAWPQYYQGNYWQSEFSTSWGINSIPAVFIVDKDGNLHSTNARGKLETMIPELLGIEGAG